MTAFPSISSSSVAARKASRNSDGSRWQQLVRPAKRGTPGTSFRRLQA